MLFIGITGNEEEMPEELVKREWCYIMKPAAYEMSCDLCGGRNIIWSEFEHLIWCYDCKKDTSGNGGIFSGPIPVHFVKMFGISFDKIEIPSGDRLYMHMNDNEIFWDKLPETPCSLPIGGMSSNGK